MRNAIRCLSFLSLLIAHVTTFAAEQPQRIDASTRVSVADVPAWVVLDDLPTVTREPSRSREGVEYLVLSRQIQISDQGNVHFKRRTAAATTSDGLATVAEVSIDFDPTYQTLQLHRVDVIRNGQRSSRLDLERAQLLQREQDLSISLYNGLVSWLLVLQDVQVGDVVDVAYSVLGDNPVFGNRFFDSQQLRWSAPVALHSYRVRAPKSRPLNTRSIGINQPADVQLEGDERIYAWRQRNTPAVDYEEGSPYWHVQFPFAQVSEYRNWAEVAEWAVRLNQLSSRKPVGDLAAQLATWRRLGPAGREQAVDYIQERVRYFGFEFGATSHLPSDPNDVWNDRFGDCKDKSLLLSVVFAGLGIDAVPALVSTSGQRLVAEMLPSPGVFNHVIVRWRDGDRIRWLDPTATHQRGPLASRYVPDYGFALLVAPGVTALQTIPVDPGVGWQVHVDERIQLAAKPADNRLEVRSRYNGVWAESMRARVGTVPEAEWQRDYSNYYARLYREATSIAAATVRDSSNENQLTVTEQYRLPRLLEESIPLTAETIANFVASPTDVQRSSPLALTYPAHAIHEIRLEHPADFELQLADAPIQVENDFLRYSCTVTRQAGTVVVRQEYSTKQQSVPSQHLPEYLDGLRRIRDAMYVDAVVVQGASTADKSIDRTAERLERIRALINGHGPAPAATEKK